MKSVTIGFVPREKFYVAPEALERLLRHTRQSDTIVVVDCDTPAKYRGQIEDIIRGRDNVKIVRCDEPLLPNASRNLVIPECRDEFLCLIENDVLVDEGWLDRLLSSMEGMSADVAIPFIMEGRPGEAKPHFDDTMGYVEVVGDDGETRKRMLPRPIRKEQDIGNTTPRIEEFLEMHCVLFRRDVFDKVGPFDGTLNASEEVDLSLALRDAGLRIAFDPGCVVHYLLPSFPLPQEDKTLFMKKWNFSDAVASLARIGKRWNIAKLPKSLGFMEERYLQGAGLLNKKLSSAMSADKKIVFVDNGAWLGSDATKGLNLIPFTERNGEFWGAPESDAAAISEVERQRKRGADLIIFTWHGSWHLEYYKGFDDYLRSHYPQTIDDNLMIGFDLRNRLQ